MKTMVFYFWLVWLRWWLAYNWFIYRYGFRLCYTLFVDENVCVDRFNIYFGCRKMAPRNLKIQQKVNTGHTNLRRKIRRKVLNYCWKIILFSFILKWNEYKKWAHDQIYDKISVVSNSTNDGSFVVSSFIILLKMWGPSIQTYDENVTYDQFWT